MYQQSLAILFIILPFFGSLVVTADAHGFLYNKNPKISFNFLIQYDGVYGGDLRGNVEIFPKTTTLTSQNNHLESRIVEEDTTAKSLGIIVGVLALDAAVIGLLYASAPSSSLVTSGLAIPFAEVLPPVVDGPNAIAETSFINPAERDGGEPSESSSRYQLPESQQYELRDMGRRPSSDDGASPPMTNDISDSSSLTDITSEIGTETDISSLSGLSDDIGDNFSEMAELENNSDVELLLESESDQDTAYDADHENEESDGLNNESSSDNEDIDALNIESPTITRSDSEEIFSEVEAPDMIEENLDNIGAEAMDGARELEGQTYNRVQSMIFRKLMKAKIGVVDVSIGLTNLEINLQFVSEYLGEYGVLETTQVVGEYGVELSNEGILESITQKAKDLASIIEEATNTVHDVAYILEDDMATIAEKSSMLSEMNNLDEALHAYQEYDLLPEM